MNSLSAIAGHEGDEEDLDWEREMRGLRNEEEVSANFLLLTTNHIISFFFILFTSSSQPDQLFLVARYRGACSAPTSNGLPLVEPVSSFPSLWTTSTRPFSTSSEFWCPTTCQSNLWRGYRQENTAA